MVRRGKNVNTKLRKTSAIVVKKIKNKMLEKVEAKMKRHIITNYCKLQIIKFKFKHAWVYLLYFPQLYFINE